MKNEKYVWLPGEVGGKFLADLKPLPDYEYPNSYEDNRWTPHSTVSDMCWEKEKKHREAKLNILEVRFYMNDPSKLHAAISSKQFFGLELLF